MTTTEEKPDLWCYADEECAEAWKGHVGMTRDEAIAEGRAYYGCEFWIDAGKLATAPDLMPDASDIIEIALERASEMVDDSQEFVEIKKGGEEALNKMLEEWASTYVKVTFWMTAGKPERIAAKEPAHADE